jgi:phage-related protein
MSASIMVAALIFDRLPPARRPRVAGSTVATYYILAYMGSRYDVELEPEVREWLGTLSLIDYRTVEYHADRLAEAPTTLGEPYSRHLRDAVRELRFHLGRAAWRISYWLAPGQRIVLLTVFRKTRNRETAQVERAVAAQRVCEDQHPPATHVYDREG